MIKTLTTEDLGELRTKLELADRLIWYIREEYFLSPEISDNLTIEYNRVQDRLEAASELLYQAHLLADLLSGDETTVTEVFKTKMNELLKNNKATA